MEKAELIAIQQSGRSAQVPQSIGPMLGNYVVMGRFCVSRKIKKMSLHLQMNSKTIIKWKNMKGNHNYENSGIQNQTHA